ncbi:MAG TPA: hypothetical protein VGK01_10750, partial [Candidatus Angelobacter sp.]
MSRITVDGMRPVQSFKQRGVRHPVYDDNGRCQVEKRQTGASRWKRSQGRPILAFILTLDGVSSAHNRAGL